MAPINYHTGIGAAGPNSQGLAGVDCAAGEKALGGGIISSGGYNSGYVNDSAPTDGGDAGAKNDDAWIAHVDAFSSVALNVHLACVGGKLAAKLKLREVNASIPAGKRKAKTASCPDGYHVTGGGVSNSATFGEVDVKVTRPVDRARAWEGELTNFGTQTESMTVRAICARGGFAKKLSYREKDSTAQPGQQKSRQVECKDSGLAIGGGTKITRAASNLNSTGILGDGSVSFSYVDAFASPVKFTNYTVCYG